MDAAVDSCFWPLYEVVEGSYRLTCVPQRVLPIEEWLRPQKRFAHLFAAGAESLLDEIQASVDHDWLEVLRRCRPAATPTQ